MSKPGCTRRTCPSSGRRWRCLRHAGGDRPYGPHEHGPGHRRSGLRAAPPAGGGRGGLDQDLGGGPPHRGRPPYDDVDPFAAALIAANPERLVWGSDWPHINYFGDATDWGVPSDADLLRALRRWTDDHSLRRILVDNPAALYGFP
ncbi:amidohydrolase family protein [Methylobacterium oryzae CBMB20]